MDKTKRFLTNGQSMAEIEEELESLKKELRSTNINDARYESILDDIEFNEYLLRLFEEE